MIDAPPPWSQEGIEADRLADSIALLSDPEDDR